MLQILTIVVIQNLETTKKNCLMTKIENSESFPLLEILTVVVSHKLEWQKTELKHELEGYDMVLEEAKNFTKTQKPRNFFFLLQISKVVVSLELETIKWTETKNRGLCMALTEKKIKFFEVLGFFDFLPYTQNWNLGNLGKIFLTSDFD